MSTTSKLPEKIFYSINEIASRWSCEIEDVEHLIYEQGLLRLAVRLEDSYFFPFLDRENKKNFDPNCDYFCYLKDTVNDRHIYGDNIPLDLINPELTEILTVKDFVYIEKNSYMGKKTITGYGFNHAAKEVMEHFDETINYEALAYCLCPSMLDGRNLAVEVEQQMESDESMVHQFIGIMAFNEDHIYITYEELASFEKNHLNNTEIKKIDSINSNTKAYKTLQKLVLGMAIEQYGYNPLAKRNKATGENAGSITADLERYTELKLNNETIKNALDEAYKELKPTLKT